MPFDQLSHFIVAPTREHSFFDLCHLRAKTLSPKSPPPNPYITTIISPLASHFNLTNQHTKAKMLLYLLLSFLGEILVSLIVEPLSLAVAALAFNPLLQARWNILLMQIEEVVGEFVERTVRRILGME
jgi:hypothetical protein